MARDPKLLMINTIRRKVVPILREKGFKGVYPLFRREVPEKNRIDILQVIFPKKGGEFSVEVTSYPLKDFVVPSGKIIPLKELTTTYASYNDRLQLGSRPGTTMHAFNYEDRKTKEKYSRTIQEVIPLLDSQAEDWWNKFSFTI